MKKVIENMENEQEQDLRQALIKLAYTDVLTGMGNRVAFSEKMIEYNECESLICVVADINNLKLCNDRYGHIEGDKVIRDVAECIRQGFDDIGFVARIGGDEFCVLICKEDTETITKAIEDVQKLIEAKNKARVVPLSVSFGYAAREGLQESAEALFNRADAMMYDVKYRMKNEFPVYREELISNYLNVLKILQKSTDDYLFLWDIARDEFWYFDEIDREYEVHITGTPTVTAKEVERFVYAEDRQMIADDLQMVAAGIKAEHNLNYRWLNRKGEPVWINCRGRVIMDDKGKPFVMVGRVSDTLLRYLYNPMTKLFNKEKLFMDFSDNSIAEGYLMLVCIDNMANINLERGRSYGNQVIKKTAYVLEHCDRVQNVWHVEGNCFALYMDVSEEAEAEKIYQQLLDELAEICTISAGAVPNDGRTFESAHDLYAGAELTLEKAKAIGPKTLSFFTEEDFEKKVQSMRLLDELRTSVKSGCKGFYLHYQPLVLSGNYQIYGAEALLRYHSEVFGAVYPDEFIPLLEQSKLIKEVGIWVLETALHQCREWRKWLPKMHINVNFSAVQLEDYNVAERVLKVLERTHMPGEALTIELTESIQLHKVQYLNEIFRLWKEAGIELSIDDFGTGYASMGYLKELDVAEIKIPKLFVEHIDEETYNYRLISNMIHFAKNNDIRICCEGVEEIKELAVLEELAPNLIQGYLFARPCAAELFERSFLDTNGNDYRQHTRHLDEIYQYKNEVNAVHFDVSDILRETDMGVWIIRLKEDGHCEMYADETMERLLGVERKYTPRECYHFWFDRIQEGYKEYVTETIEYMMNVQKVVQLQYPWNHPKLGEVTVRCSGKRTADSDGMVTLKGYHRIADMIEERLATAYGKPTVN